MFEKEAEDNKPPYAFCAFNTKCELWKDGFQKGAKFGYNKAKVEVEDSYRESLCNSELNLASITEQLEELEKSNEWHYLQENPSDLPKNREKVLLLMKLHDKWNRTEVLIGYRDFGDCLGEYCKGWGYFEPVKNRLYDFVDGEEVIAWREIKLPEKVKESDLNPDYF